MDSSGRMFDALGAGLKRATAWVDAARIARGLLTGLIVSLLAVALPATAGPTHANADASYPAEPLVPAQSARAFGDSVGVNVHIIWTDTSYGDFETIQSRLRELGVRYVRDGLCAGCEHDIVHLNRLASVGIRANLIAGDLSAGTAQLQQNLQAIRDRVRQAVVTVEAPNEPDQTGDPQWLAHTRAYQQDLYARVKRDPSLASLPVLGPALVYPANWGALGDLTPFLDRGNFHPYPGGGTPFHNLADLAPLNAKVSGNKPVVATEAGYHSDLATTSGHPGTSERAIGIYTPRLALEGFRQGIERTYVYQLADPWSATEAAARGIPPFENSFGLLRSDLARKPAFLALRNLMTAAGAGSAPVSAPGGLRFGLEGAGQDVRQLLLRSADGSFALVLWREVSVWDRAARQDLFPGPEHLNVVLGERLSLAQRFDPVDSEAERQRWAEPGRIPIDLAGAPVILRLAPPGVAAAVAGTRASAARALAGTKKQQRLGRHLLIKVSCAAPCATVTAKAKLVVKPSKRSKRRKFFNLKAVKRTVKRGVVTLRLTLPAKAQRAAAQALKHGGRVTAQVTVTARSARGRKLWTARKNIALRDQRVASLRFRR